MKTKIEQLFANYIGQAHIVRYFITLLTAIATGKRNMPLQPLFLTGYAGLGKTHFAKMLKDIFEAATGLDWEFVELSSSIALPQFVTAWVDKIEGRNAIIFMDEAGGLNRRNIVNLIKRLTETERSVVEVREGDFVLTSNPFQHLWIMASNEAIKDTALCGASGRFDEHQFLPYTMEESLALIQSFADKQGFSVHKDATEYLANRVMPNARAISMLVENDCNMRAASNGDKVDLNLAKKVVSECGYFSRGLRKADIATMQFLGRFPKGAQVNEIAAACGGEAPKTTSQRLQWLAGYGFVQTINSRKALTTDGAHYLAKLEESQRNAKAAAKGKASKEAKAEVITK